MWALPQRERDRASERERKRREKALSIHWDSTKTKSRQLILFFYIRVSSQCRRIPYTCGRRPAGLNLIFRRDMAATGFGLLWREKKNSCFLETVCIHCVQLFYVYIMHPSLVLCVCVWILHLPQRVRTLL